MKASRSKTRSPGRVSLLRGDMEESVHAVHGVAAGPQGELLGWFGDPDRPTMLRSAAKPFQALPLVEDGAADAFGIEGAELALTCGSHGGEPSHVALARGLLGRGEIPEVALACGPHPPMHTPSARALFRGNEAPGRIHNNCSGKHAGMLLLARYHGWPLTGYHQEGHPVQRRMRAEVARWTGSEESALGGGVDGCGVVCFAAPLQGLARAFAALGAAAVRGDSGSTRIAEAMTRYPHAVAGTGRLCSVVMAAGAGRVLAKVGAEGVYGASVQSPRGTVGIALKVEDGGRRAAEAALLAMLDALAPGWATGRDMGEPAAGDVNSADGGAGAPPAPAPHQACGRASAQAHPSSAVAALAPWMSGVVPNTRGEPAASLNVSLPAEWLG